MNNFLNLSKVLDEKKSKFNGKIRVVRSLGMGTYIQANGLTQSGGIVESIWKSTLKKINLHGFRISNSLILGIGGGTLARLIVKYFPGAKITGVDIDPLMVELGEKYLGLETDNLQINIGDAYDFLFKNNSKSVKYDFIAIDLYNGDSYPEKFKTEKFISLVENSLTKGGVAIFNRLYYGDKRPETVKFGKTLEKIFPKVTWVYPEANLMFICRK